MTTTAGIWTHFLSLSFVTFVFNLTFYVLWWSHKFDCRISTKFDCRNEDTRIPCHNDFLESRNFWKRKKTCFRDCLKELSLITHIMMCVVTQNPSIQPFFIMNALHHFSFRRTLVIHVLKSTFHFLILHDFTCAYLS